MEDKYKKLYESLVEAVMAKDKQIATLSQRLAILETEKIQWELEKVKQQLIISHQLSSSNTTNNTYLEENKRLKEEIARLKG